MTNIVERLRDPHTPPWPAMPDAADEIERLRADAARWRYVRDYLTQGIGPHPDGYWQFRFLSLFECRQTVEEAIDAQIAKVSGQKGQNG